MFLNSLARWIEWWAKPMTRILSSIGAAFLCLMMLWVVADVTMRALFNRPILGSFEIVEYGMVFFVFLALAFAQFNNAHIRVPIVVERLNPRIRAAVDMFSGLITVAIVCVMTWGAWLQTGRMIDSRVTSQVLMIPKWPFELITVLGLAAFAVAKVTDVLTQLATVIGGDQTARDTGSNSEEMRVT